MRRLVLGLILFVALFMAGTTMLAPERAYAQQAARCQQSYGGFFGLPTWYKYLLEQENTIDSETGTCDLMPLRTGEGQIDPNYFLRVGLAVFEIVLRIGALTAIGFVIFGGFQFLTSQGEPDKVAGARTTIMNALIGLMITIAAVGMVNLVGGAL